VRLKDVHFLSYLKKKIFKFSFEISEKNIKLLEYFVATIDRIILFATINRPLKIKESKSKFIKEKIEIYIGILVKDRPIELMNLYLSIKNTLNDMTENIHIYFFDDNSKDFRTLEILNLILKNHPNVSRVRRDHSENSWNSAHNWAINTFYELSKNDFDIIGTIDSDMVLANDWVRVIQESVVNLNLKKDLPIQYISIFNSDDRNFHRWKRIVEINGTKYVIKLRMGGATLFFLKKNFKLYSKSRYDKMGKHYGNFDDESRMTRKLLIQGLYCASTLESYAEHLPTYSILDSSRRFKSSATKALNLKQENFDPEIRALLGREI